MNEAEYLMKNYGPLWTSRRLYYSFKIIPSLKRWLNTLTSIDPSMLLRKGRRGSLFIASWLILEIEIRGGGGLNRGFTAYLTWSSTKNIFLSSKTFAVRQVLEILLGRTYSYPKFPVLWGRIENRRQRSQTIWGLGSFAPARYGGNNQKCGKRQNINNKGIWV